MPYLPSILRPLFERAETALLRHGTEPRTILFLAVFSVLDGFLPMLPAEIFVLSLCILQPKKGEIIVLVFAAASALSAFLLALALGTLTTSAETLSQQLLGAQRAPSVGGGAQLGACQYGVFFYLPRLSAFLHRATGPKRRSARVDRWDGLHWQADALRQLVGFDPSLASEGGSMARCRAVLAAVVARPR